MEFITIKEAMALVGKSEKTIRNLIQSSDSQHVGKKGRELTIEKSYLLSKYSKSGNLSDNELVRILKERIESLEKRLDQAHTEKLQMLQSLRVEQIKTLPEAEKQKILQLLQDGE